MKTTLYPALGWQQAILECWHICCDPFKSFREKHDQASRLLWIAQRRSGMLIGTVLGDVVGVTAKWWLAEHHLHSLQRRIDTRRLGDLTFGTTSSASIGHEPVLANLTKESKERARDNVGWPTTEDIRASANAVDVQALLDQVQGFTMEHLNYEEELNLANIATTDNTMIASAQRMPTLESHATSSIQQMPLSDSCGPGNTRPSLSYDWDVFSEVKQEAEQNTEHASTALSPFQTTG